MARAGRGIVAAGHPATAEAAADVLRAGGNAYDAAVAGLWAACVAEPILASLGGGGFLLAQTARGDATLYDFFAQTPGRVRPADELDFRPVMVDFGAVQQEFHTGLGAIATPGMVAGLFNVNVALGKLPMRRLLEPAIALARDGVLVNETQAYVAQAVSPIALYTPSAKAVFESAVKPGETVQVGEVMRLLELGNCLEILGYEGPRLFYDGEIAAAIENQAAGHGGSLRRTDLEAYRVIERRPLTHRFGSHEILGNPAPSSGGPLIAFALALLEDAIIGAEWSNARWFDHLAQAMARTNEARRATGLDHDVDDQRVSALLRADHIAAHRKAIEGRALKIGGTTHISVIDAAGNAAAATVSNGEGCGHMVPGAGFMANNMLGEEDINPRGFFNWQPDQRISSMMAPTLVNRGNDWRLALGSGGSNRIRTAILQVLCNVLGFSMPLNEAVEAPRLHYERGRLNVEDGFPDSVVAPLQAGYDDCKIWPERNFFFGGVHGAQISGTGSASGDLVGAGDPRRGGVVVVA